MIRPTELDYEHVENMLDASDDYHLEDTFQFRMSNHILHQAAIRSNLILAAEMRRIATIVEAQAL